MRPRDSLLCGCAPRLVSIGRARVAALDAIAIRDSIPRAGGARFGLLSCCRRARASPRVLPNGALFSDTWRGSFTFACRDRRGAQSVVAPLDRSSTSTSRFAGDVTDGRWIESLPLHPVSPPVHHGGRPHHIRGAVLVAVAGDRPVVGHFQHGNDGVGQVRVCARVGRPGQPPGDYRRGQSDAAVTASDIGRLGHNESGHQGDSAQGGGADPAVRYRLQGEGQVAFAE
eukprot:ctg_1003.g417